MAPGPNGFSVHFYQECWDIIKNDLMKVFFEFFERGATSIAMRSMFLILIPKLDGAREMGDYQPISLVSNLYKIISKVLACRLKDIMGVGRSLLLKVHSSKGGKSWIVFLLQMNVWTRWGGLGGKGWFIKLP